MRERIVSVDGSLDIKSKPGKGFKAPEFGRCLEREIKKWKFKPFQGPQPDVFAHEFNFVPVG